MCVVLEFICVMVVGLMCVGFWSLVFMLTYKG